MRGLRVIARVAGKLVLPGVLGGETSAEIESFQDDDENIEFPQYTRPENFRDMKVPDVLLTGHHAEIEKWRAAHSQKAAADSR